MPGALFTQPTGRGIPGQVYGDWSDKTAPNAAEAPWAVWRGTGTPGRTYGTFDRDPFVLMIPTGISAGAPTLGEPSAAKQKYTQLRHGPLPGPVYGSFAARGATFTQCYAANLSVGASTTGTPTLSHTYNLGQDAFDMGATSIQRPTLSRDNLTAGPFATQSAVSPVAGGKMSIVRQVDQPNDFTD